MSAEPGAKIRVAELFAGVGGFRLGLEYKGVSREFSDRKKNPAFRVVWSNQFEPKTTKQHASDVYVDRFNLAEDEEDERVFWSSDESEKHVNKDINDIEGKDVFDHDLLVAGFPCQDYSVMRAISREVRSKDGTISSGEAGIKGPKGELWWQIEKVLRKKKPGVVFLENVPRLLTSPAIHKGRNFAIVIRSLIDIGYDVEWRIINAEDYGMPQSRKRVFILAYKRGKNSLVRKTLHDSTAFAKDIDWLVERSPFAQAFPLNETNLPKEDEYEQVFLPEEEEYGNKRFFLNAGLARLIRGKTVIRQKNLVVEKEPIPKANLLENIVNRKLGKEEKEVYSIPKTELEVWRYLKGMQRNEFRIKKTARDSIDKEVLKIYEGLMKEPNRPNRQDKWDKHAQMFEKWVEKGHVYRYDIGAMRFPDGQEGTVGRTIVTSEGGSGPSRTRHIIRCRSSKSGYRRLMPVELERLNQFPDNWTEYEGISDSRRGFLMGNALVVGIVERLAKPLAKLFRPRSE